MKMEEILKGLRQEIKLLRELQKGHAPDGEYFFAFDNKQFEEGKTRIGITDNNLLCRGPAGIIGTEKGINEFFDFYENKNKRISEQISPLAYFCYEYANHEGEINYDNPAWKMTKEMYPNFNFNDPHNAKVVKAIKADWEKLNFGG